MSTLFDFQRLPPFWSFFKIFIKKKSDTFSEKISAKPFMTITLNVLGLSENILYIVKRDAYFRWSFGPISAWGPRWSLESEFLFLKLL